ncbi:hypothetical protein PRIPAC_98048 [Pristionchus pacificus]|uniref:Uncharacterized protein n=1 Tax=Pristionchus pacificus TaxID=54126 RepID=A0A454Y7C1_PRIPA|nr:hypothetical protein PRIPAC_98048 [Pristionchus pacificus]|eukprot:PDM81917.1 hypothetical protein PRIPAC_34071 [Pristionchus pacificus]
MTITMVSTSHQKRAFRRRKSYPLSFEEELHNLLVEALELAHSASDRAQTAIRMARNGLTQLHQHFVVSSRSPPRPPPIPIPYNNFLDDEEDDDEEDEEQGPTATPRGRSGPGTPKAPRKLAPPPLPPQLDSLRPFLISYRVMSCEDCPQGYASVRKRSGMACVLRYDGLKGVSSKNYLGPAAPFLHAGDRGRVRGELSPFLVAGGDHRDGHPSFPGGSWMLGDCEKEKREE